MCAVDGAKKELGRTETWSPVDCPARSPPRFYGRIHDSCAGDGLTDDLSRQYWRIWNEPNSRRVLRNNACAADPREVRTRAHQKRAYRQRKPLQ